MNLTKWLRVALLNLMIVAAIGVVLRYKIAFSLPFIDQKKLLHGHSHFAFSGWITQALMALIVSRMSVYRGVNLFKRYNWVLYANLICSYSMLLSFPVQGYGFVSITFSTLSLLVSYVFAMYLWADIKKCGQNKIIFYWFKVAVFFNALSSVGAFSLAFMMATKNLHQNWYLAAVYFFLHFQYNGWFSFAILGLLFEKLEDIKVSKPYLVNIFLLFAFASVPAYFLSALWMPIPFVIYLIVVLSSIAQFAGWVWTISILTKKRLLFKKQIAQLPFIILSLSVMAFSLKFLLQLGSTIPALSKLTFGFRPIVIGYLHLVLLGVVTLFILGYAMYAGSLEVTMKNKIGIWIFITGIIFNELVLMVQGFTGMSYIALPYINESLFIIAVIMFSGLLVLNWRKQQLNVNKV